MQTIVLKVEGMSCFHCENAVKKAVSALDGVSAVEVSLKDKTVTVSFDPAKTPLDAIKLAIEDEGYEVA